MRRSGTPALYSRVGLKLAMRFGAILTLWLQANYGDGSIESVGIGGMTGNFSIGDNPVASKWQAAHPPPGWPRVFALIEAFRGVHNDKLSGE
jgi:hypothetical protein